MPAFWPRELTAMIGIGGEVGPLLSLTGLYHRYLHITRSPSNDVEPGPLQSAHDAAAKLALGAKRHALSFVGLLVHLSCLLATLYIRANKLPAALKCVMSCRDAGR